LQNLTELKILGDRQTQGNGSPLIPVIKTINPLINLNLLKTLIACFQIPAMPFKQQIPGHEFRRFISANESFRKWRESAACGPEEPVYLGGRGGGGFGEGVGSRPGRGTGMGF
jgi:hypothetical protein